MKFKNYYNHYLSLHQNKWCRCLHIVGNLATLGFICAMVYTEMWLILLLTPFIVYPFAWSGHFFFEKNKPAAWNNPLKAKACDWKMMWDILRGHIKW